MSITFLPLARTCPTPLGSQTTLGPTRPAPPPQSTLVPTITISLPTPPPSTNTQPTPPLSSTSLSSMPLSTMSPYSMSLSTILLPTLIPFTSPTTSTALTLW